MAARTGLLCVSDVQTLHVEAMDTLITDWHGQLGIDLPGGVTARRRYGRLCFDQGQPAR